MGSIYKRYDKYWYIVYDGPPDPVTGKRKQHNVSCRGLTQREAAAKLREIESAIARGEYHHDADRTLAEYLEEWLEHAKGSLAASTHILYGMLVRAHIVPALGGIRLGKLTPLQLQRFYTHLRESGGRRGHGLAPKTLRNIHGVLHRALDQAVRWQMLAKNPADAADPPRGARPPVLVAAGEDIPRLLEEIQRAGPWRLPLLIAIGTGMRRGEVLALQWQDYDAANLLLLVRRAISTAPDGSTVVKGTKTDRPRVVAIHDALARELDHQRDTLAAAGAPPAPTDWICRGTDGAHLHPPHLTKAFEHIAAGAGVRITLHGLRHTHATALIAAGIPVKVVSERLGHSTVVITQDTYAHVLPTMQRQAADATAHLLTPKSDPEK